MNEYRINDPANLGNDLFALDLGYNDVTGISGATARHNGNISYLTHATAGGVAFTQAFDYDGLNRLKTAGHAPGTGSQSPDGRFTSSYNYDVRGNLTALTRTGDLAGTSIDNLTYAYAPNSNRLIDVTDAGSNQEGLRDTDPNPYAYDSRGNATHDGSRGHDYTYNHLDLPAAVNLASGQSMTFQYTADGSKLIESHERAADTIQERAYLGPFLFERMDTFGPFNLTYVNHPAGRLLVNMSSVASNPVSGTINYTRTDCAPALSSNATVIPPGDLTLLAQNEILLETGFTVEPGGLLTAYIAPACEPTYQYQYFLTDHLGNIRVTFADPDTDGVVDLLEEHHYYPFGLEMERGNAVGGAGVEQRYRYNGIEHVEELGLDMAFYRSYDPAIGRWMQVDPKGESFTTMSPYTGMGNNPLIFSDMLGDSLYMTFSSDRARGAFEQLFNSGLEGQFRVNIGDNGKITITGVDDGGDVSKLSKHGQAFYEEMTAVINGKGETNVNAEYASEVPTGRIKQSRIDIADMLQYNGNTSELGGTALGKLTHELVEQFVSQEGSGSYYRDWDHSHPKAVNAENHVNDSFRDDRGSGGSHQYYTRDGQTVLSRVNSYPPGKGFWGFLRTSNIINVVNEKQ